MVPIRKPLEVPKISHSRVRQQATPNLLDHINYNFEAILQQRLYPIADEEKVRLLIKFIKMERKRNNEYLSRSKDYIYNHLMFIVKKISYNELR